MLSIILLGIGVFFYLIIITYLGVKLIDFMFDKYGEKLTALALFVYILFIWMFHIIIWFCIMHYYESNSYYVFKITF